MHPAKASPALALKANPHARRNECRGSFCDWCDCAVVVRISSATAAQIKLAITQTNRLRRASVAPPLLDAEAAYQILSTGECEEANSMNKKVESGIHRHQR